jgi:hypothetical protein
MIRFLRGASKCLRVALLIHLKLAALFTIFPIALNIKTLTVCAN